MDNFQAFLDEISSLQANWSWVNMSVVALKDSNKWILINAYVWLDIEKNSDSTSNISELITIFNNSFKIEKLEEILGQISEGYINLDGKEILIVQANDKEYIQSKVQYLGFYNFNKHNFIKTKKTHEAYAKCCLYGSGTTLGNILKLTSLKSSENLNGILQGLNEPYLNLEELIESKTNARVDRNQFSDGSSVLITITAPVFIRFSEETSLDQNIINIKLISKSGWNFDKTSLGVILSFKDRAPKRFSINLKNCETDEKNSEIILNHTLNAEGAYKAIVILRQEGKTINHIELFDYAALATSPRQLIFEYINPLYGKNPQNNFESFVSIVFHLAGFDVAQYGQVGESNYEDIDIIAFMPNSKKLFAIECTLKEIDNKNKLAKFSRRVKDIREILVDYEIRPILVTKLEIGKLHKPDVNNAIKEQIIVITPDLLSSVLEKARSGEKTSNIYSFISNLNPAPIFNSP